MRRIRAKQTLHDEWMAPLEVVRQVNVDYIDTLQWFQINTLFHWRDSWNTALFYLTGHSLKQFQRAASRMANDLKTQKACFTGILRAHHVPDVRYFSSDGLRCLVFDQQSDRRIATYNLNTQKRLHTESLPDVVVVMRMFYDSDDQRWKHERHIQDLPHAWLATTPHPKIDHMIRFTKSIGRDQ